MSTRPVKCDLHSSGVDPGDPGVGSGVDPGVNLGANPRADPRVTADVCRCKMDPGVGPGLPNHPPKKMRNKSQPHSHQQNLSHFSPFTVFLQNLNLAQFWWWWAGLSTPLGGRPHPELSPSCLGSLAQEQAGNMWGVCDTEVRWIKKFCAFFSGISSCFALQVKVKQRNLKRVKILGQEITREFFTGKKESEKCWDSTVPLQKRCPCGAARGGGVRSS